ncbi:phosphatidylglycerol--membrane-oligosaccharide glycerophosphotransferase, putative [Thalassobium sp. R2A62]|nr:phosphatidylglycerol--membrane-oligosaccharide glycerophosphotransferase, putative [Thalassobium sp. R2A62]
MFLVSTVASKFECLKRIDQIILPTLAAREEFNTRMRNIMSKRSVLASLCAATVILHAFYAINYPADSLRQAAWSLVIFMLIMLVSGRGLIWKKPDWKLLPVLIVAMALVPITVIFRNFGRFDILAIMHHWEFGLGGFTLSTFDKEIADAGIISIVFFLGVYWLYCSVRRRVAAILIPLLVIMAYNPMSVAAFELITREKVESDLVERIATPQLTLPAQKIDVIIVLLEGVDRTFRDQDEYGDIYDGLRQLEDNALVFTNVRQTTGTGWSMAGLVASQCGLPLLPAGLEKSKFHDREEFIYAHNCLSDVLAAEDYVNTFVVGADTTFAGLNHFLRTHLYTRVIEDSTMREIFDEETQARSTSKSWWKNHKPFLDDTLVFEAALMEHASIIEAGSAVAMTVETVGPHGSTGVLSHDCTDDGQARRESDISKTVKCTISSALTFLEGIESQRSDRPTLVVFMSDHLNHDRRGNALWPEQTQSNTMIMMGLGIENFPAGVQYDRLASMVDIYPTLLHLLGLADRNARAGLGVSLLGDHPTLVEEKDMERLDLELSTNYDLRSVIWNRNGVGNANHTNP